MVRVTTQGPDAPCALSVRGLTIIRKFGRDRRLVLEDISLSAQPGEITAILGAPCAGKTSLLAAIAGLLKVERGAVLVGGTDVTAARPARRGIGFLPPGAMLDPDRPLGSTLGPSRGRDHARPQAILAALGLPADLMPGGATHGQGFAALTAARLLADETVLLVDEAGTGLDWAARDAMLAWLRAEAGRGRAILLATRHAETALAADHLVLLQDGRVLQAGTPASVYTEPRDQAAALLTGSANILRGTLRQKTPGTLVWVAEGHRFVQADMPGQPPPALGCAVMVCLRPARVTLWSPALPNRLPAQIAALTCRGDHTVLCCDTPLGTLQAYCDTPSALRAGMAVDLGWTSQAATVLTGGLPS